MLSSAVAINLRSEVSLSFRETLTAPNRRSTRQAMQSRRWFCQSGTFRCCPRRMVTTGQGRRQKAASLVLPFGHPMDDSTKSKKFKMSCFDLAGNTMKTGF